MLPHATLEDVIYAYRLFLGRQPDQPGLEHYARMVARGDVLPTEIGAIFAGSEEFAASNANRYEPIEVQLDGYSMYVRREDKDIGKWILERKEWEPHVTSALRTTLKRGDTFIDVGANIGYFSAMAAHLVGPSGRVIAVEPMEKNTQLILATAWKNDFKNLLVLPYAASDDFGVVSVATVGGTSNGSVAKQRVEVVAKPPRLMAQSVRLDDILGHVSKIDLLKFDIEGFELNAWRGFERNIESARPILLTEFHPKCLRDNGGIEPASYIKLLFEYGVSVTVLNSDGTRGICTDVDSVIEAWHHEDTRLNAVGAAHLDLFVIPRN